MLDLKMPYLFVRELADGGQVVFGDSRLTVDQLVEMFDEPADGDEDMILSLRGFENP